MTTMMSKTWQQRVQLARQRMPAEPDWPSWRLRGVRVGCRR